MQADFCSKLESIKTPSTVSMQLLKRPAPGKQCCCLSHDILSERTPVARDTSPSLDPNMLCSRDHRAGSKPWCDLRTHRIQFLRLAEVSQSSKIPIATVHFTWKQAQQALQQQASIFCRTLPVVIITQGSDPMRFDRIPGDAILNDLRTSPKAPPNAQSASTSDAPMQKERESQDFHEFPNPSTFAF